VIRTARLEQLASYAPMEDAAGNSVVSAPPPRPYPQRAYTAFKGGYPEREPPDAVLPVRVQDAHTHRPGIRSSCTAVPPAPAESIYIAAAEAGGGVRAAWEPAPAG
jgi:hypothetical protein